MKLKLLYKQYLLLLFVLLVNVVMPDAHAVKSKTS